MKRIIYYLNRQPIQFDLQVEGHDTISCFMSMRDVLAAKKSRSKCTQKTCARVTVSTGKQQHLDEADALHIDSFGSFIMNILFYFSQINPESWPQSKRKYRFRERSRNIER